MAMQNSSEPMLDSIFRWSLDASTQLAIIVFLIVGLVSTIWSLAIRPLLITFSVRYRQHLEQQMIATIRPVLISLGLMEEVGVLKALKRVRTVQTGRSDEFHHARLMEIMREHFSPERVMLGKKHSDPSEGFIDLRAAAMDPQKREVLADVLANRVASELRLRLTEPSSGAFQRVIGLKEGNPLIAALVAQKLDLPFALFRGTAFPRVHASTDPKDAFDGEILPGERVVIIDDTTFRGTTLIEAAQRLTALKAVVSGAFLLFEPEIPTARESLSSMKVELYSVVRFDDSTRKKLSK